MGSITLLAGHVVEVDCGFERDMKIELFVDLCSKVVGSKLWMERWLENDWNRSYLACINRAPELKQLHHNSL